MEFKFAKLFYEALSTSPSNPRREAAKQEIRSAMIDRIKTDFLAVITKFRAVRKLLSTAQTLGAGPSFLTLYRNDPETLARFVFHEREQASLRKQELLRLDNPNFRFSPIATLIDQAEKLGVPSQQIEANRRNPKELQRHIVNQRRGHPDDFWLTDLPMGEGVYREFLSEPCQ